jgi:hypothetical protein
MNDSAQSQRKSSSAPSSDEARMNRRSFLRKSGLAASAVAAIAASLAPLRDLTDGVSVDEFLQKHYK